MLQYSNDLFTPRKDYDRATVSQLPRCNDETTVFFLDRAMPAKNVKELGNEHDRERILCEKRVGQTTEKCRNDFYRASEVGRSPIPCPSRIRDCFMEPYVNCPPEERRLSGYRAIVSCSLHFPCSLDITDHFQNGKIQETLGTGSIVNEENGNRRFFSL